MILTIVLVVLTTLLYFLYKKKKNLEKQVLNSDISSEKNIKTKKSSLSKEQLESFKKHKLKAAKPMLWISMVSMAMVFAGLTSGYIVRRAEGNWLYFDIPYTFYISTILIIFSSIFLIIAKGKLKNNESKNSFFLTLLTLILGFGFLICQFLGWENLKDINVYFTGPTSNASGSFFYVITFLHLLHLIGGLISLIIVLFKIQKNKYSPENMLGFELSSIFWHFLGILWLYLFIFLLYIR